MHVYNAWLPPPVAEETKREKESFARVVRTLGDSYRPDDPDSVYSTLNWIPLIKLSVLSVSRSYSLIYVFFLIICETFLFVFF